VHIGGTSGKGSTSAFLQSILTSAGLRSGLHTSPYLQVATEKLQIGHLLVDPDHFADLVEEVLDVATSWSDRHDEKLSYGEIWMGLIGCFFRDERVDIGVIEVGAGGRFDLTNVIDPVLSIITSVGLDHVQTLGHSLEEIAWHKAGIIKPGAPVVTAVGEEPALSIVVAEADSTGSRLIRVVEGETYAVEAVDSKGVTWVDAESGTHLHSTLPGAFQAANGSTAIAAARELRQLGFTVSEEAIVAGIANARIPGRNEIMQHHPAVLLDGAHNPQKVEAFARGLSDLLPASGGRRVALLGILDAKAHGDPIATLLPQIDVLITTSPQVTAKPGLAAERLADVARSSGFTGRIIAEPVPQAALERALELIEPEDSLFVTGSLYLIGNLRGYWQPEDEILLHRTQWPRSADQPAGRQTPER
jgi:dihydrofolate synthase/folylpolyglutamate synthase